MPSLAWPLEEIWLRPLVAIALSALVPFVSARLLALITLPAKLPDDPIELARAVAPFRQGAFIVGIVQIQLAATLGAMSLGPRLVGSPDDALASAFGALCAVIVFCAGGPARSVEGRSASPVRAQIALRLRMVPWFAGPVLVSMACARLPIVVPSDAGWTVAWGWALASLVLTALGVAFAGPLLSIATFALVRAPERVRAMAERVAEREGVPLLAVLRLPTHGVHFANAAALPWARTMIVTDHIVTLLDDDELEAVLAHEAGHLSEGWTVVLARLGSVALLLFALSTGLRIGEVLWPGSSMVVLAAAVLCAVPLLVAVRNLARRMEERADEHARRNVSPEALAGALTKLHLDARMPLVTGAKRIHPDLYDRLCACGREMGPRPAPPPRRLGLVGGLVVSLVIALPAVLGGLLTPIEPDAVQMAGPRAGWWRLFVDPWDGEAMLAVAWGSRRNNHLDAAEAQLEEALRLGATQAEAMELEAELLAARHDCVGARARFDAALRERARRQFESGIFEPLELGGYHLPPALVTECGYGEQDD